MSSVYWAMPIAWSTAVVLVMGLFKGPFRSVGCGKAWALAVDLSMSCKQYSAERHSLGKQSPNIAARNFTAKPLTTCSAKSRPTSKKTKDKSLFTLSHKVVMTEGNAFCTSSAFTFSNARSKAFKRTITDRPSATSAPTTMLTLLAFPAENDAEIPALTSACAFRLRFATRKERKTTSAAGRGNKTLLIKPWHGACSCTNESRLCLSGAHAPGM
mmetsp:Transcript_99989/g.305643  ORF Transcript_99989/g.305643 Transcript_99989/m.305643 type:complete len:214 (-) Transcript_99989:887-1528(-)